MFQLPFDVLGEKGIIMIIIIIIRKVRKAHAGTTVVSKSFNFPDETRTYSIVFWLSLPVHSGPLKRIDYPKQICLAHPVSFECFHCS